jgi:hypothetical protein
MNGGAEALIVDKNALFDEVPINDQWGGCTSSY